MVSNFYRYLFALELAKNDKTKVSIITVILSILQTSPDQFRVFKSL